MAVHRNPLVFDVDEDHQDLRLDVFLSRMMTDTSRTTVKQWVKDGFVTVDGGSCKTAAKVKLGQRVVVSPPASPTVSIPGEPILLDMIHEDEYLAVINKPAGMVVHPAGPRRHGTLVNALIHRWGRINAPGGPERPGIVHRLDKGTSGLIMVARDEPTYLALAAQIQGRLVRKWYRAIVWGIPHPNNQEVRLPIGRHHRYRKRMAVTPRGKDARSILEVVHQWTFASELEIVLLTGRTHQIRVHLSYLGHPVFGDADYGGRRRATRRVPPGLGAQAKEALSMISRPALHSWKLAFRHPKTDELMSFLVPPPADYRALTEFLSRQA